jgi:hypothetical protein
MDADRKNVTWKHLYKYMYTENDLPLWGLIDFENLKSNNRALFKKFECIEWTETNKKFKKFVEDYQEIFSISGDADFTLKNKKYNKFINEAESQMHMFKNFSLMPCIGAMNNAKGRKRFTEFISMLDAYYKVKDVEKRDIKPLYRLVGRPYIDKVKEEERREKTPIALKKYLDFFDGIYDYCDKVYFIDNNKHILTDKVVENFVDELIDEGKKIADNKKYCELAKTYWDIRKEKMKKKIPKEEYEEYCDIDISDSKYE